MISQSRTNKYRKVNVILGKYRFIERVISSPLLHTLGKMQSFWMLQLVVNKINNRV